MWPSALLHQGFTDLVTTSFVLSDAQPVLKVLYERREPRIRLKLSEDAFKAKQAIKWRVLWRVGVFPHLNMIPAHTQTHAGCRGLVCACPRLPAHNTHTHTHA